MTADLASPGFHDALVILGAAGIVIPAFARLKISPVIGFILFGIIAGPFGLGTIADRSPLIAAVSIADARTIAPFADLGIVLLLFAIGLELSFRRLAAMRGQVFGIGAAELALCALLIGSALLIGGTALPAAAALGVALAMSSTALVLPIAGTQSPLGRAALAMLLFEDLALVPLLFLLGTVGGGEARGLGALAIQGTLVIGAMLLLGRFVLPLLFAQAARTKSPELFLAISLLVVILASGATNAVGLGPIIGALIAGLLIAETDYRSEVEVVTAPFRGLALGVFLITVGMRIDLGDAVKNWPQLLGALALVLIAKTLVTGVLLRVAGARRGVAAEAGLLMASPSETSLILLGSAGAVGALAPATVAFWSAVAAIGLTITPVLASAGRIAARRVDRGTLGAAEIPATTDRTLIFGFGRVGRMVADMLGEHGRPYLAVDSDVDSFVEARAAGYSLLFGDVARHELLARLDLGRAAAVVLTMDDPVLTARVARLLRSEHPQLPIIARARDTAHAAALYKAGVTDAVPETLEASLQLSEAVLVDIGLAMGPVIASIHEKRSELRAEIMAEGEMAQEPRLGRRRVRDSAPAQPG